ncbi:MAG TPA: hypothetical protein VFW13_05140 [Phenylobacterium sp.]|nr:hypothetical protein [Phenylobacterium sp.]
MTTVPKLLPIALAALCLTSSRPAAAVAAPQTQQDGSHAFDFEFGAWKCHLSRRLHPLTGSTTWVEYDGTSVVRPVWNGAANLGELELDGPAGHLEGLSLRLYNPQSRQWGVSFSNSAGGTLGPAMVGGFKDGRGEFYDQEVFNDRAIFVRFIFSDITAHSFQLEQAFSDDGGKTWEANWIAKFTR